MRFLEAIPHEKEHRYQISASQTAQSLTSLLARVDQLQLLPQSRGHVEAAKL
jgi:hypothetical protein